MKKVLITGAAGKTGLAIIRTLSGHDIQTYALIHRPEQADRVIQAGAIQAYIADFDNIDQLREALVGKDAVYHICPNMSPDELIIGKTMIHLCHEVGLKRFIYHSVLHPQVSQMAHHWNKLLVEQQLFESKLDFTILQPTAYMQNILGYIKSIRQGIYPMPYPTNSVLSLVDLNDVAEAALAVLSNDGHTGATYELVGTPGLRQTDVAKHISKSTGQEVRAVETPLDEWEKNAIQSGLNNYAVNTLKSMFIYYKEFGLFGSPSVLTWLIGHKPTTLDEFLSRELV